MYEYMIVFIIAILCLFFVKSIIHLVILMAVTLIVLTIVYVVKQKFFTKSSPSGSPSGSPSKDIYSNMAKVNIYGEPLEECQPGERRGGSQMQDGTCSELGGGVHQICVKSIGKGRNFSSTTGQSGWSSERGDKNHCACLGAWANYVAASKRDGQSNDKSLNCKAIPSTALDKNYIKNWSKWNDVTINNQIHDGLDELYTQCSARAPNEKGKQFLQTKYNLIKNEI